MPVRGVGLLGGHVLAAAVEQTRQDRHQVDIVDPRFVEVGGGQGHLYMIVDSFLPILSLL